jgi:CHAD domain-containing protein
VADLPEGMRVRIPLGLSIPRLLGDAGYSVESSASTQRRVQLYDTGDRRLAAAGAELSLSPRDGWTWRRNPLGHPKLTARDWAAPTAVPQHQLMQWSRAYRRGRPLAVRALVTVHRRSHRISDARSDHILSLDEERYHEQVAGRWASRLRRVTLTTDRDGVAAAQVLALIRETAMDDAATLAVLRPALVRAPRLRLPDEPSAGARALFTRSATLSLIQWLYFDCELSGGGAPDALRKLRVALRRLRSDLQTFAPLLDRHWADDLRDRLGALAGGLGVVRDAEVLSARLGDLVSLLPQDDHRTAVPLLDIAGERLAAARAELLDALAGDDYVGLLDHAMAAVTAPRWAADAGDPPPVNRLARRPWRRLRDYVTSVDEPAHDTQLHRIRILAKRARYAADACAPAIGDAAVRSAQQLADLQTVLGEHHDAAVTREWLQRQAVASPAVTFAAGELAALELGRLRAATDRWRDIWAAASRKQDWRWLRS